GRHGRNPGPRGRRPAAQAGHRLGALYLPRRGPVDLRCDHDARPRSRCRTGKNACRARRGARDATCGNALMFGRLTWDAIPFDQPIPLLAGAVVMLVLLGVLAWVVVKGWAPYLWNEWITSVDHKHIGIMYVLLGLLMLLRGFIDAIMMRTQQALAYHA